MTFPGILQLVLAISSEDLLFTGGTSASRVPHEQITQNRLWNKRPDGIAFKMPTNTKVGVICLMEFKRMSDVTNQYVVRAKRESEQQYQSFRSVLSKTIQRPGWMVEQIRFIAGPWSLNKEELKKNLEYFKVPNVSIEPIRSKLGMKIFDEYANILKGMHSLRFNVRSYHGDTPTRPVLGPTPTLINSLTSCQPNKVRKPKDRGGKEREQIIFVFMSITLLFTTRLNGLP